MNDGTYEVFTVEFRRSHEGKWGEIGSLIKPIKKRRLSWGRCGPDSWEHVLTGRGNANEDLFDTKGSAHVSGWQKKSHAVSAMKRLVKASTEGKLNGHPFGNMAVNQERRYEFRIVKLELFQKTTILEAPCTD